MFSFELHPNRGEGNSSPNSFQMLSGPARGRACEQISFRRGSMAWPMVNAVGTRTEAWPFGSKYDDRTYGEDVRSGAPGGARGMTSENVGLRSRHRMSEDLQLQCGLGLWRVVSPQALSISTALMLSPSSVSGSSQDGMTAYTTSVVGRMHRAWNRSRASMISVRSWNGLLAVSIAARASEPNTRPKGLDASPESRVIVLDERRRNYLLPTGPLSSQESLTCGSTVRGQTACEEEARRATRPTCPLHISP
jgi:hypothetical protein